MIETKALSISWRYYRGYNSIGVCLLRLRKIWYAMTFTIFSRKRVGLVDCISDMIVRFVMSSSVI